MRLRYLKRGNISSSLIKQFDNYIAAQTGRRLEALAAGLPRSAMSVVSLRPTRWPEIEVLGIAVNNERRKSYARHPRPINDRMWFGKIVAS